VGLARGLRDTRGTAGLDYQVVTVSINDVETPKDALAKKRMSLASIEKPYPDSGWRFLVGDDTNIDALADSIGFSYRRNGEDFDHPLGAIVLSPEGKIVRYMIGPDFLAVDINMSLMEASAGLVRPTIAKMLRFCVSYDPNKKQFGFDVLRVSGIVTTILVACLAIVLVRSGAKRRRAGQGSPR
jgi:protein SCO1/2